MLSVTSSHSCWAGTSLRTNASLTIDGKFGSLSWRGDTLTDIVADGSQTPSSIQRRSCVRASSSAHAPIGTMVPVSSAIGMNSIGETTEPSACCQRIKASKPITSPLTRSRIG